MEIGEKIREARKRKGLTQEELGELIGVKKSAIAKYETGRVVNIKRTILQKITVALNMEPTEIVFDELPIDLFRVQAKVISDFEMLRCLEDYYKLSSSNQKIVRDLIKNIVKE